MLIPQVRDAHLKTGADISKLEFAIVEDIALPGCFDQVVKSHRKDLVEIKEVNPLVPTGRGDVRDVTAVHVLAITNEGVAGTLKILQKHFPGRAWATGKTTGVSAPEINRKSKEVLGMKEYTAFETSIVETVNALASEKSTFRTAPPLKCAKKPQPEMPASFMHLPNKISPQSFHFSSKSVLTSFNDPIMKFYTNGTKLKVVLDTKLLFDTVTPEQTKLGHLEQVMWSAFEFEDDEPGMALASAVVTQGEGRNEWLQFHQRMIRRNESILYDLDMIGMHIGQFPVKSRSDLVLQLSLSRRTDEEICLRLSHICFKLWKLGPANVDEKKLVLDIQAYARMLGLSHLKHAVSLLS
ncbi:hypothetical protein BC830DRAFT_1163289 [Chytriomyces sp. MP71]|nr:hypothetical protein BC830DRAFT_1163289 [Chytriomyces sp. MP71]